MPPPSKLRADVEAPDQVTEEGIKGFLTGVARFGSLSIIAHLILALPHPLHFADHTPTPPSSSSASSRFRRRPIINPASFYRPLMSISESIASVSKVYRGLTPQFKVFLQIAAMTFGGCIWAERRVQEYMEVLRKVKRAERRRDMEQD
ncbi:hypothetical protein LOZ53_003259 [Ophidiomyces ophidiicola]|uniref:Uncharacterized protein n=1 Tax=Ophidiomyces ophidiicola TaxID=1387563 RepID=A0ACB8UNN4_9EURO|nr:uncharacterized protein LOZ57_001664 [Ophidiomyces ophidiicola]KAI1910194.1 hypothetical protein LOZ61_004553 [Ophidiomyces ophidiicola]KAI1912212.1 hypothetical protein LOZ64_004517 [Ophidiomyces ophidiicola]KAI1920945.1 hypothetical protein LOZ65_003868 [Ophidiomyces ophidiicola]KAI1921682.1 hypothetical protein LOZ60_006079 [Ophidiomyces ophidiicola]KAI1934518.1 hypothetical protein LOZ62_006272 [Ophidiomyces ophidiicola]